MVAVIDDDPTGAQAQAGVPVVVSWGKPLLEQVVQGHPRAVHLLTNSRALEPRAAYRVVREASQAVTATAPEAAIILRGDSTLRGHLREEYEGLRDAAFEGRDTAQMLVPALPAAGRVTVDGVHRLERDGESTPLDQTEYARDGLFTYRTARLLDWAEQRSGGLFAADNGRELHLDSLRTEGPQALAHALAETAARAPAAFVPDARTDADLDLIAAGLRCALAAGTRVIVRCAPAFAARFARTAAEGFVPAPRARRGLLVACGSYVPATTRQLQRLLDRRPARLIELDTNDLAGARADRVIDQAASKAAELLADGGLAVVATSRPRDQRGLAHGERVARGLARVVALLRASVDIVLSKGGITSAVNLSHGLGVQQAQVIGPLAPGISLWLTAPPEGERMYYVVFPGNVGGDDALVDVVDKLAPV